MEGPEVKMARISTEKLVIELKHLFKPMRKCGDSYTTLRDTFGL